MSGRSSSSSSLGLSGSAGLAGFVGSLNATWRTFLLRFALAFVVLAVGWWALAPAYARVLMALGRPLMPVLEASADTRYWVQDATVWTTRSFLDPATQQPLVFRVELWKGYASYDLILLAALILATPGWSLRQRGRLLVLGLAILTLAEFAFFVSTIKFTQLKPVANQSGVVLLPAGFSRPKQILFTWLYYFFQTMGRGLFPLLVYAGMIGVAWKPVDERLPREKRSRQKARGATPRNAPCPCGSGRKYKHCCGAAKS
jgi:hypothetical protein